MAGLADDDGSESGEGNGTTDLAALLAKLKKQFDDWDMVTLNERTNAMRDRDYYDGVQWTAEQAERLAKRKQPVITFNRIATKLNYVLGSEVSQRLDPRAYPRSQAHEQDADAITDMLRYLADADDHDGKRSAVAGNVLCEGDGGVVFETEEPEDEKDPLRITTRHIPWEQLFWDPASQKPDFSDARYMGAAPWMDIEEARIAYPGGAEFLTEGPQIEDSAATTKLTSYWDSGSARVRIVEHYYQAELPDGGWGWWKAIYTAAGFLEDPAPVEWVDEHGKNWCPIVATSAYVRGGSAASPERYGIVRNLIGPQDEINHRRSKAIHLMHSTRTLFETGAIESPDEFQAEMGKPDGMPEVKRGTLSGDRPSLQLLNNADMAMAQVQMLQEAKAEIDQMGPHAAQMDAASGRISGRLYMATQEAGSLELKPVFDNLRRWSLEVYRRYWWLARQFFTRPIWLRVRDVADEQGYKFVALNRKMSKLDRLTETLDQGTGMPEAFQSVFGPDGKKLYRVVEQMAQAEWQQAQARQAQQAVAVAQQQGQPPQPPQQQPQPTDEQKREMVLRHLQMHAHDVASAEFTQNDIPGLDVDIVLDATPHSALIEHEQFTEIVGMVKEGVLPPSPELFQVVIESSAFRNKARLLAIVNKPPDPKAAESQQQQQQLALAQLQAAVAKLQAESARTTAQAQLAQIQAQQAVPAQAQLDLANAALAGARAQALPPETQAYVQHKQIQTLQAAHDAGRVSVVGPGSPGQPTGPEPIGPGPYGPNGPGMIP